MTAVRWVVEHRGQPPVGGGWVEYPAEADAHAHAGTDATVWALVAPELVHLADAAATFVPMGCTPEIVAASERLLAAVNAVARLAEEHA